SSGSENTVLVWEVKTGRLKHKLDRYGRPTAVLVFSPNSDLLSTASDMGQSVTIEKDGSREIHTEPGRRSIIDIHDLDTGNVRASLEISEQVASLAMSPDGKTLAIGCFSGALLLWNWETRERQRYPDCLGQARNCLAFAPDGRTMVIGSG